ncbi:zinc finger protein 771-like [Poeciliopsis prolifica]|uniref:zinc finger protein 771-like n=1 Tax=Poeciliopsis prolifica TaxID=188132 RepID=UPI0024142E2C|nr:zinc finger protein 771-like [Poeciliopsis prolifica]
MCSALNVREFIRQRLAAAAEEIFGVFEKTVIQYEEELDRQRRLMETSWETQIPQRPADFPQQHIHLQQEELPAEQLLCHQQEEPKPPQVKEEQEEPGSSLQTDQLEAEEESKTFLVALLWSPESASGRREGCRSRIHKDRTDSSGRTRSRWQRDQPGRLSGSGSQSVSQAGRAAIKCGVCGKVFRKNYHLKMHHMSHTGVKPHVCNECGKSFKAASTLRYHARMHTGERPYSCETCGKSFRGSYSMLVHMRTHTGEKPYLCNTCGKRFTNSSAFKWHTAIHMGDRRYSCQICGKSFTQSGNLKAHVRTHTGEKKHCCKTCGKRFSRSNSLIVHMRTHTGEKPYSCSSCGERFQYAAKLKKTRHNAPALRTTCLSNAEGTSVPKHLQGQQVALGNVK